MDTQKTKQVINKKQQIGTIINSGGVIWSKEPDLPGPKDLIGGNMEAGFFGECPTNELITGDALAKLIGLSAGTSQYSNGGWLKFIYMGQIEFIAKKPFRHSISWDSINSVNAVFGNRTIEIKGHTYKIRLMKGKTEGKQADQSSYRGDINKGSEWNKLLLPIYYSAPSNWRYPDNVKSPTEDWGVRYFDYELITKKANGSSCWCQEYGERRSLRLTRGYDGVSDSNSSGPSYDGSVCGWRPVLEFVK